ncbi:hypothetical protein Taro_005776, partial [Colocasia esculenta]|nr:hypothetical protein [Colocasia esculenta]
LRVLSGCLVQTPDCCFCNLFHGAVCGGTGVCFPNFVLCPGSKVVLLVALDLVEVRGSHPGGETSVSRGCSVSLVVTPGCSFPTSWRSGMLVRAEGYFRIVFDSAGSAGVVSGPTLVVGHGVTLFCCFVVLCSRQGLAITGVRFQMVEVEVCTLCVASSVSCPWVAARPSRSLAGSGDRVVTISHVVMKNQWSQIVQGKSDEHLSYE